ncbi:YoaK family protein [Rhodopila globiformis]|nr:YoaK family protein [Rhodopila globiformis]
MAFLAGATDVCGLFRLRDLFVSFMSGNTTMLALALGQGHLGRAMMIAGLIGLFMAGAFVGTVIAVMAGRRHLGVVTLVVAVMLAAAAFRPVTTAGVLAVAMGILNAAMHRAGAVGVSLTYVTGVLVKFAQGLGHVACGRPPDPFWYLQGVLWLALLAGAAAATLALLARPIGNVLLALSLLALLLALVAAFRPERPE